MFSINQVQHTYSGHAPLQFPDIRAQQGDRWLLLGNSGSGKTTLLHILAGLLRPENGRVTIAGQNLGELSGNRLDHFRGQKIGIIFQQFHLLPSLTVMQNLLAANYLAGAKQDRQRAHEVLASLDIDEKADAYPHQLSVGQQQRAAIARSVINRPQVLLADEPTAALDDVNCEKVIDLLIRQAAEYNATLCIATHDRRIRDHFEHHIQLNQP